MSDYDVDEGGETRSVLPLPPKDNSIDAKSTVRKLKKPRPVLDPQRLLSERGFKYLRQSAPKYLNDLSGSAGHESDDINKIVIFLNDWSKYLFPKMGLREFCLASESICQQKIMKEYLRKLKDAFESNDDAELSKSFDENEFYVNILHNLPAKYSRLEKDSHQTTEFDDDELNNLLAHPSEDDLIRFRREMKDFLASSDQEGSMSLLESNSESE